MCRIVYHSAIASSLELLSMAAFCSSDGRNRLLSALTSCLLVGKHKLHIEVLCHVSNQLRPMTLHALRRPLQLAASVASLIKNEMLRHAC
eukprot:6311888-Amphidinium_carterae.1